MVDDRGVVRRSDARPLPGGQTVPAVGVAVPARVHLAPVPTVLVEVHPAWRGYEYFVYNDQVIVVEPRSRHIVEVIVLS